MGSLFWAWLASGTADSLVVRVAIDDRQAKRLDAPVVYIEGLKTPLLDNGALPGDVAGDLIYVGQANIQHQESVLLRIENQDGTSIGEIAVSVPKAASTTFQLKTSSKGIVLDLNAPNMPIREAAAPEDETPPLLIQGLERAVQNIAEGQSEIRIEVDAQTRKLNQPMVTLNDRPEWTMLVDDGSVRGDVANDGLYVGLLSLPSRESLGFRISDSGRVLGNLQASLPSAQGVLISLRYNQYGLGAVTSEESSETGSMVVQATPKGERIASTSASDKIALTVHLDDRLLQRLQVPSVSFVAQESAGVNFRDDGSNGDEEASDHVWMASTVLEREEFVQLKVIDGDAQQGQLTVFLPSTSEAVVWLRSTETGIKLVTEPTQSGSSDTSTSTDVGGGSAVTSDRLAHVLWVMITLFAIGFAYVRTVVQERWKQEISPVLGKMNQFLDAQGEREGKQRLKESPSVEQEQSDDRKRRLE